MGLEMADDSRTVYVADSLRNSVQIVDIEEGTIEGEISLGGRRVRIETHPINSLEDIPDSDYR